MGEAELPDWATVKRRVRRKDRERAGVIADLSGGEVAIDLGGGGTEFLQIGAISSPSPAIIEAAKAEVEKRHAAERALVDLVNNPPAWAEPTAWRAAVLAAKETIDTKRFDPMRMTLRDWFHNPLTLLQGVLRRRFKDRDPRSGTEEAYAAYRALIEPVIAAYERARFQPSQRLASVGRERPRPHAVRQ